MFLPFHLHPPFLRFAVFRFVCCSTICTLYIYIYISFYRCIAFTLQHRIGFAILIHFAFAKHKTKTFYRPATAKRVGDYLYRYKSAVQFHARIFTFCYIFMFLCGEILMLKGNLCMKCVGEPSIRQRRWRTMNFK